MNLYSLIGAGLGTIEAASLSRRLAARHERRGGALRGDFRAGGPTTGCEEDGGHSDARALWAEAVARW